MEQALVFASIVLGVAVAFELQHLNTLLRSKNVKWHWAQPIFALFVLLTIMSFWWMIANRANSEEAMTLARFLPIMWILVLRNLLAAAALTMPSPATCVFTEKSRTTVSKSIWLVWLAVLP